jgi:hypothetical protein
MTTMPLHADPVTSGNLGPAIDQLELLVQAPAFVESPGTEKGARSQLALAGCSIEMKMIGTKARRRGEQRSSTHVVFTMSST